MVLLIEAETVSKPRRYSFLTVRQHGYFFQPERFDTVSVNLFEVNLL